MHVRHLDLRHLPGGLASEDPMRKLGLTLFLLALLPGCTVFFGDDDSSGDACGGEPAPQNAPGGGVALPPQSGGLRNPIYGDCEFFGCGGGVVDGVGSPPASPRAALALPD